MGWLIPLVLAVLSAVLGVAPAPSPSPDAAPARQAPPTCRAGALSAEQLSEGGPAAGTFYTPIGITNPGADCRLLDGDLVLWVGAPPHRGHRLVVTGAQRELLMATGVQQLFYATVPNLPCDGYHGQVVSLSLSNPGVDQPTTPVTGPGLAGYARCRGVGFIAAGHRVAPSR
jgi:hypothetical protein